MILIWAAHKEKLRPIRRQHRERRSSAVSDPHRMATALIYSKLVGTQKFLRPRPDGPTRRMGFTVQWSDAAPGADAGNDTLPIPQGGVSPL